MRANTISSSERTAVPTIAQEARYPAALTAVPGNLMWAWMDTACEEFAGIPRNAMFFARSLEGLLMFFDCASRAGRQCGLPSRAADSVWHSWLRMDRHDLDAFCRQQFGARITHVEAESMRMDVALAATLVEARRLASRSAAGPSLPALFALDRELQMPHGFGYRMSLGLVGFRRLDERGVPLGDATYPEHLTPYGLFQAGLISEAEYDSASRLAGMHADLDYAGDGAPGGIFAGGGPDAGDADGSGDAGGSDGSGGDAGGGDGGGCGGGCGGSCGS